MPEAIRTLDQAVFQGAYIRVVCADPVCGHTALFSTYGMMGFFPRRFAVADIGLYMRCTACGVKPAITRAETRAQKLEFDRARATEITEPPSRDAPAFQDPPSPVPVEEVRRINFGPRPTPPRRGNR